MSSRTVTLLPTYSTTGIAAATTALLVTTWSAFFIAKKSGPFVLLLFSILLLLVGGGYGPIPMLILAAAAGPGPRSSLDFWRKLPRHYRRLLGSAWAWFMATVFIILLASILWGHVSGMNRPSFSRETYASLAMATGLLQVFFAFLATVAAAARDAESA